MSCEIDQVRNEYNKRYDNYERLKKELLYILRKNIDVHKIPLHDLDGRIKTLDSFERKIKKCDTNYPFKDINDICGIRIICLFLSDIKKISQIIEDSFKIITKDDKISSKSEEEFGYLSVHFIGSLPSHYTGPRYDDLKGLNFEIQLRTIAMHAWSTISHYLDYKSTLSIPPHLRKDFNALSALFYLADSHFELFYKDREKSIKILKTKANDIHAIEKEEINLDSLSIFLRMKYPKRKHAEQDIVSNLFEEIIKAGYKKIADLNVELIKSEKALKFYEKKYPVEHSPEKKSRKKVRYTDVGTVRISLSIANEKYIMCGGRFSRERLKEFKDARKYL